MTQDRNSKDKAPHAARDVPQRKLAVVEEPPAKPASAPSSAGAPSLAIAFRGYDRAETDALVGRLEASVRSVALERDGLHQLLLELEQELEQHRSRAVGVGQALIAAQAMARDVREVAEREAAADRAEAAVAKTDAIAEAAAIRSQAQEDAAEVLREAHAQGDRLLQHAQRSIRERHQEAESVLDETKVRLDALVCDLLGRLASAADPAPAETPPATPALPS